MSSSKKRTEQTNTPGWSAPPDTADVSTLRNTANSGSTDFMTPVRNQYARARQEFGRSYDSPLGPYGSADVDAKAKRSQLLALNQNEGMDLSQAAIQGDQAKFGQQATVAGLTAPRFYTAKQSGADKFALGDYINMGVEGVKAF